MFVPKEPYLIFREKVDDNNIIGNLKLDVAKAIHEGRIIEIDHLNHHMIVKKYKKVKEK